MTGETSGDGGEREPQLPAVGNAPLIAELEQRQPTTSFSLVDCFTVKRTKVYPPQKKMAATWTATHLLSNRKEETCADALCLPIVAERLHRVERRVEFPAQR